MGTLRGVLLSSAAATPAFWNRARFEAPISEYCSKWSLSYTTKIASSNDASFAHGLKRTRGKKASFRSFAITTQRRSKLTISLEFNANALPLVKHNCKLSPTRKIEKFFFGFLENAAQRRSASIIVLCSVFSVFCSIALLSPLRIQGNDLRRTPLLLIKEERLWTFL